MHVPDATGRTAADRSVLACRPAAYKAYGSSKEDAPACDYPGFESTDMELVRHVSFVDCPGTHLGRSLWMPAAAVCPRAITSAHLST